MSLFVSIISRIIALGATILSAVGLNYLFTPAWSLKSAGLWLFFLIVFILGAIFFAIAEKIEYEMGDYGLEHYIGTFVFGGLAVVALLSMIIGACTGARRFHAEEYHDRIEVQTAVFEDDIPKVTSEDTPVIVDVETAKKLGDRVIATGKIKNLSWYDVDSEYNLIKYQGDYYRISELNYGGFMKYRDAKYEGIPGYIIVNVFTQEAKYVELDEPIRYSESAYGVHDLKRHLRNQFPEYMFYSSYFEIDDEGTPYYITAPYKHTIGLFGGDIIDSFIITNASTGESKEYKTEYLPEWVDHAYGLTYLMSCIEDNQKYGNGYKNTTIFGAKTGVNYLTYSYGAGDYNTAITANGDIVFYTGVTPANAAETNIGFIYANPRTGKVNYYECPGAEETSAMAAAEGLVQNLGYSANFPVVVNIEGMETYLMLLKDNAGLIQRYALCNIRDYSKVVQAKTFKEAYALYLKEMNNESVGEVLPEDSEMPDTSENVNNSEALKTEGVINNLYEAQIDGCTFYYFTVEGSDNLYMSSIKNSNKQVLLKEGTKITIDYTASSEEGVFLVKKIQF